MKNQIFVISYWGILVRYLVVYKIMSLFFSFSALKTLTEKDSEYMKYLNIINKQYDKQYYSVFDIKSNTIHHSKVFIYPLGISYSKDNNELVY